MGRRVRLREGLPVSVCAPRSALASATDAPPLRPAAPAWRVQGPEGLLGLAEGLASWSLICLVFLGTGGRISRTTGPGTGLGEARTVPTSRMTAAGMTTCAGGPTAGSARQSWTGPPRRLLTPKLFPQGCRLLKAPHFGVLLSGASCRFLGLLIWAAGRGEDGVRGRQMMVGRVGSWKVMPLSTVCRLLSTFFFFLSKKRNIQNILS